MHPPVVTQCQKLSRFRTCLPPQPNRATLSAVTEIRPCQAVTYPMPREQLRIPRNPCPRQRPAAELAEPELESSPAPDQRVSDNKSIHVRPRPRANLRCRRRKAHFIGRGRSISLTGGAGSDAAVGFGTGMRADPQPTDTSRLFGPSVKPHFSNSTGTYF